MTTEASQNRAGPGHMAEFHPSVSKETPMTTALEQAVQPDVAHFDVLIVGAGLSGIAAAAHLQMKCPRKSFAILERRASIGGTWDLFKYPGIRSDSDMATLGYSFRPWRGEKSITDGPSIRDYVRDTARERGIDTHIRFGQSATRASWSSQDARWTIDVTTEPEGRAMQYTCSFLFMCSGYYDYSEGYTPDWADANTFGGTFVHPQHWPTDLALEGKKVVVIGSGATAVTLIPELAKTAAHVTMLQRSPTYVVSRPSIDAIANWLHKRLPATAAHFLARWKNVFLSIYFYGLARRRPDRVKKAIVGLAKKALGPDFDVDTHFTPKYNPWDQRLCLVPDNDLFDTLRSGKASVVTDTIERFTPSGITLQSGKSLDADIVVAATGLKVQLLGGLTLFVDGKQVDTGKALSYKGMMFSDVPNFALALGYTNASWTLKCELTAQYVCRLLNHMDAKGYAYCTPRRTGPDMLEEPALPLTSGYVQRANAILPKQGTRVPWRVVQNYAIDMAMIRFSKVADESMQFTKKADVRVPQPV
jgi:cation diffusion facilitator CzcD-associated flavoprotein CzcO